MIIKILAFVFALCVLVFVHELGHYLVARWCGVKVLRFSIGFGKPLLTWRVGPDRTEWSLSPIPLGGYVKMLDEREEGQIAPEELHRAFTRKSLAQRSAIVVAGPVANFLLAIALYAALGMAGLQEPAPVFDTPAAQTVAAQAGLQGGDRITQVNGRSVQTFNDVRMAMIDDIVAHRPLTLEVVGADGRTRELVLPTTSLQTDSLEKDFTRILGLEINPGELLVGSVAEGGAAATAGLQAGDQVLAVQGEPVRRARDLIARIRAHADRPLELLLLREGAQIRATVTPRAEPDASAGAPGAQVGRIGAALQNRAEMVTVELGLAGAVQRGIARTWEMSVFSLKMLGRMVIGDVSLRNLSGPVAIADYAGQAVQIGWFAYVGLLALLSVSLGVLNLLPVPVLDGGHLLYYALEAIKGRPLSERFLQVSQKFGVALVAGMMIIALFNDLTR